MAGTQQACIKLINKCYKKSTDLDTYSASGMKPQFSQVTYYLHAGKTVVPNLEFPKAQLHISLHVQRTSLSELVNSCIIP